MMCCSSEQEKVRKMFIRRFFVCLFVLPKRCVVTVVAGERLGYTFSYVGATEEEEEDGSSFRLEVKLTEGEVLIWSHDFFSFCKFNINKVCFTHWDSACETFY